MTLTTHEVRLFAHEVGFGRVQLIFKHSTVEKVLERANDSESGLGASAVSDDINFVNAASCGVEADIVRVNCRRVFNSSVPFGG